MEQNNTIKLKLFEVIFMRCKSEKQLFKCQSSIIQNYLMDSIFDKYHKRLVLFFQKQFNYKWQEYNTVFFLLMEEKQFYESAGVLEGRVETSFSILEYIFGGRETIGVEKL